ncbi:photosynthetic complex assembly protein PuhC [Yoonia sp. R2331]|uniref:photosynthetic complex assembly protein PuhC n=1 Tax=Yoonia sp. R2331 TaxID=3237238 RepID=UPI0034E43BDA
MSQLEQQMRHRDREMVPKVLVQAMFALMVCSLGLVSYAKLAGVPQTGVLQVAEVVQSRDIVLLGDRSGVYRVMDASGAQIAVSSEDKAGFLGVMGRVIDRQRLVHDVESDAPVQVVRRVNDNIAILDPTTGMAVELIGYGQDNVAAFARLLD